MNRRWVHAVQAMKAALWSCFAIGLIVAVDRGCFPEVKKGWQPLASLSEIPARVRFEGTPAYLPNSVRWPPARILVRENPAGWWYGLADTTSENVAVWLGEGDAPLPDELKPFTICMDVVRGGDCPQGWHYFSSRLKSGRMVMLLTRLAPLEGKRILNALDLAAP